jgi:hypothetical protein
MRRLLPLACLLASIALPAPALATPIRLTLRSWSGGQIESTLILPDDYATKGFGLSGMSTHASPPQSAYGPEGQLPFREPLDGFFNAWISIDHDSESPASDLPGPDTAIVTVGAELHGELYDPFPGDRNIAGYWNSTNGVSSTLFDYRGPGLPPYDLPDDIRSVVDILLDTSRLSVGGSVSGGSSNVLGKYLRIAPAAAVPEPLSCLVWLTGAAALVPLRRRFLGRSIAAR